MASTEPIKQYLAALAESSPQKRAQLLSMSIGGEKEIPKAILYNVDRFLTQGTLANEIALKLLATEVSKRKVQGG